MFYGVAYYPEHWPEKKWATDAKNMRNCGMDGVRIGEFAWCRMEPKEGQFSFEWLDRAITVLGKAGLKVILGTPTATPPSWLMYKHPTIAPTDANGIQMKHGVRKYYCHANKTYRQYASLITSKLAERYGENPYVVGWQVDNEFGDHDTVRCYCSQCRQAFTEWVKNKYHTVDNLNTAWGTVFWSQEYSSWEQLDLPYPRREIGLNPSHLLDYYRFASDQVVDFCSKQSEVLRNTISEKQWITTNVIATYWEIDFKKLSSTLDFLSWDCYTVIDANSPVRKPKMGPSPPVVFPPRPEMVSFVHDMIRSCSQGPFWVMETAGQDRLVAYHTLAHGGAGVNFFRWKGSRFGAEQGRGGYEYHGIFSQRFHESTKISQELHQLTDRVANTEFAGQVGLLYSFDMGWAYDIKYVYPRSVWIDGIGYWRIMEEYYTSFWRQNIPVHPIRIGDGAINKTSPSSDILDRTVLSKCQVLVAPCLYLTTPEINQTLCDYVQNGGILIVGPASGTKDWNNVYLESLPPGKMLGDLFGCELVGTGGIGIFGDKIKIHLTEDAPFAGGQDFFAQMKATTQRGFFSSTRPSEYLRATTAKVFGRYPTGQAACTINDYGKGKALYLGFSPEASFMQALIAWLTDEKKVCPLFETPAGVEVTVRKGLKTNAEAGDAEDLTFILNHTFAPAMLSLDQPYHEIISNQEISGNVTLAPQHTLVLEKIQTTKESRDKEE